MGWTAVGTIGSTAAAGASGSPGPRGADGTKVLVGSAPPSLLLGNVGDLYFQTPPAGSTGPILIPGPQGLPGLNGQNGTNGLNVGSDGGLFTPVNASAWKFVSNNSATSSTKGNVLQIYAPAGNNDLYSYFYKKGLPTPPYSLTCYLTAPFYPTVNFSSYGMMFFDSVATKVKAVGFVNSTSAGGLLLEVGHATDGIAHIATDDKLTQAWSNDIHWFRLRDDNVNQYYDMSPDGVNWINLYNEVRNTNVTPDSVGFYVNVRNATYPSTASMLSYAENGSGAL